jgi:hypothetical protein
LKNEDVIFSGSGTPFVQFFKLHGFSLGSLGEAFDGTMAEHLNDRSGRKRVRRVRNTARRGGNLWRLEKRVARREPGREAARRPPLDLGVVWPPASGIWKEAPTSPSPCRPRARRATQTPWLGPMCLRRRTSTCLSRCAGRDNRIQMHMLLARKPRAFITRH